MKGDGRRHVMGDVGDGTGAGLLAFLDWAGTRGEISPSTAKTLAVAVGKILAVEADPAGVDVKNLNLDDLFGRFETLNRTNYTTDSLTAYRSRFFRAVAMYKAWLDKRPDWKSPSGRTTSKAVVVRPNSNGKPAPKKRAKKSPVEQPAIPAAPEPAESVSAAVAMVPYDLPLRPGLRVRLVLPELLTQADASRIAAFVDSLAFDQAEATTEGA